VNVKSDGGDMKLWEKLGREDVYSAMVDNLIEWIAKGKP